MKPFLSDGCTGVPDFDLFDCCEQHDAYYHDGSVTRFKADLVLFQCIVKKGKGKNIFSKLKYTFLGLYYWAGVRIFGASRYNV